MMHRWRELAIFSLLDNARLAVRAPRCAATLLRDCALGVNSTAFPRRIGLFLTNRCDFACEMCAVISSRTDAVARGADMPFSTVEQVLTECSEHQPVVDLLGGEPLLYPRLPDAARFASERRVLAIVTTNGFKLKDHAESLVESGLPVLQVSLDGWDEQSQRERGHVKGSFDRLLDGIRVVKKARGRRNFPIIRILTTITRTNHAHLERIQAVVAGLGVPYWAVVNYFYINQQAYNAHQAFALESGLSGSVAAHAIAGDTYLTPAEVQSLQASLKRVRDLNRRLRLKIAYAWNIDLNAYYSSRAPSRQVVCALPYTRLDIEPGGHMALCVTGKRVGQIGHKSIAEVWRGKAVKEFRSIYERARPMPMCFRCCGLSQTIEF